MKERFDDGTFRAAGLAVVTQANQIIAEYNAMNLKLTVRQLYYRFVAKGLIENTYRSYKNLANTIDLGRKRGLIDWADIEDRTRNVERPNVWKSPADIMSAVANQYKEDPWIGQEYRIEVWVEKEALVGVIEQACEELRVPFLACRGYLSQSEAYDAGKRFQGLRRNGLKPVVLHLGDHDPSGIDMTRDNTDRITEFSRGSVEVVRLALNRDQIDEYDPPPNPAKETDSRFETYREEHGDESWELDALEPTVIIDLVQEAIRERITDQDAWDAREKSEAENKLALEGASENWEGVKRYVKFHDTAINEDLMNGNTPDDMLSEIEMQEADGEDPDE